MVYHNNAEEPVIIYHNGWYFIAKEIAKEDGCIVYEIDMDIKVNGFPEIKDAVMYYRYSVAQENKSE